MKPLRTDKKKQELQTFVFGFKGQQKFSYGYKVFCFAFVFVCSYNLAVSMPDTKPGLQPYPGESHIHSWKN